jgi:hypothetical protein
MLIDLSDDELATAAQCCRARANQEGERAKTLGNPILSQAIENTAARYRALGEKFEAARAAAKHRGIR